MFGDLFNPDLGLWVWLRRLADLMLISCLLLAGTLSLIASGPVLLAAYAAADNSLIQGKPRFWPIFKQKIRLFWPHSLWLSALISLLLINYLYLWPNFLLSLGLEARLKLSLLYSIAFISLFILAYLVWLLALALQFADQAGWTELSLKEFLLLALSLFFGLGWRSLLAVLGLALGLYLLGLTFQSIWPLFILPGLLITGLARLYQPVINRLQLDPEIRKSKQNQAS